MPYEASRALESTSGDRVIKENAHGSQVNVYDKLKYKRHDKLKALEMLFKIKDF